MLEVKVTEERIFIGERFSVCFQRTLRVPEGGRPSKLPPGFGPLPLRRVAQYAGRTPAGWRRDGVFIPLDEREATWLSFYGATWKPNAVKVGVGSINAVSGEPWSDVPHGDPQDYVVCPLQLWLDGINTGENLVRQFVAVPLGEGYTVESQATGGLDTGGMRLMVFEPKPGLFPDRPPEGIRAGGVMRTARAPEDAGGLGVGAGGRIEQRIYPDPYGVEAWDQDNRGEIYVYLAQHSLFRAITGVEPPPSPVSVREYEEQGPGLWFELADESLGDLAAPDKLSRIKSDRQLDTEKGHVPPDEKEEVSPEANSLIRLQYPSEDDEF